MKVSITDIKTGKIKEKEVNFKYQLKEDDFKDEDFNVISDIDVAGKIYYADGGVFRFDGNMQATCNFICDRCGNEFTSDFEAEFFEEFKEDVPEEDDDYFEMKNDEVDLSEGIIRNFKLNLPLKILCSDTCEGLKYDPEETFEKYSDKKDENSPFKGLQNLKF